MAFAYRNGVLCAEDLPLEDLGRRFGTPCYVYSRAAMESAYREFLGALAGRPALVCYSVKANPNLAVLALMAGLGAGFDIVSGGELSRVLAAGGDPRKTVFSGVGKSEAEILRALEAGVMSINLESEAELARVNSIAGRRGLRAPVAFRVNPDVDAKTHPYISTGLKQNKFGVAYGDAERLYLEASRLAHVQVVGVGFHIGSQMTGSAPFIDAASRIVALVDNLDRAGIHLSHIDLGGGFGIRYKDETPAPIAEFLDGAIGLLAGRRETLVVDPGRAIVGNAGVLLTRVEYVKTGEERSFLVADAAMNDLLRPALYGAWHDVMPLRTQDASAETPLYDLVGPVCESADILARDRRIAAREGDMLAIMSAGAYGMSMSSNYNSRPRAAEVMVSGREARLVRRREAVEDLYALEQIPSW